MKASCGRRERMRHKLAAMSRPVAKLPLDAGRARTPPGSLAAPDALTRLLHHSSAAVRSIFPAGWVGFLPGNVRPCDRVLRCDTGRVIPLRHNCGVNQIRAALNDPEPSLNHSGGEDSGANLCWQERAYRICGPHQRNHRSALAGALRKTFLITSYPQTYGTCGVRVECAIAPVRPPAAGRASPRVCCQSAGARGGSTGSAPAHSSRPPRGTAARDSSRERPTALAA